MNRQQLARLLRACDVTTDPRVLVMGSQAVLGTWDEDELPPQATASMEVDIAFLDEATRGGQRRRGLASAVLRVALEQAYLDGFQTSSLQSTQMAQGVYQRLGYVPVGTWQEWTPGKVQSVTAATEAAH